MFRSSSSQNSGCQPRPDGCFFPSDACSQYSSITSLLLLASMTNSSPTNTRDADELGRQIHQDEVVRSKSYGTESTEESIGLAVVQPSFDDHGAVTFVKTQSQRSATEFQSRSPPEEKKVDDTEPRNPSSPAERGERKMERRGSHTRNLSALLDATTISDEIIGPEQSISLHDVDSRKHRRMFSGDKSNPNLAHRRLNSSGNAAQVMRRTHHERQPSEGMDLLSAAANATKNDTIGGRQSHHLLSSSPIWGANKTAPRSSLGQVSSSSSTYSQEPSSKFGPSSDRSPPPPSSQMEPPPHRRRGQYPPPPPSHDHHSGYVTHFPNGPSGGYHHYSSHPGSYYHQPLSSASVHPYPPQYAQAPEYYRQKHNHYNSYRSSRLEDPEVAHYGRSNPSHPEDWGARQAPTAPTPSMSQGVQTSVTAIADKENPAAPPSLKNTGTNTDQAHLPVPSEVGHHRKMSSFSSLGTIFGSSLFPSSAFESDDSKGKRHHRNTSSSVSFLNGLDVGLEDANFLRNLQASNSSAASTFRSSPTQNAMNKEGSTMQRVTEQRIHSPPPPPPPPHCLVQPTTQDKAPLKLASGGASKRVRRKCTAPGCMNRVVQGGLCISHGAKRKTCKHPGCTKNVKKAGLCSTHGPARKRCVHPGCPKVAVQGGRCIAHGAKKKLCSVEECTKQSILSGMCKKHHDQSKLLNQDGGEFCRPVNQDHQVNHKPTHTRGLSIFQEMSADVVSSILNDPAAPKSA
mmetsp:Transcript_4748/g.9900  ORF Transcript_4748/g.9900 Transcript_4748/m.9900 type:complete len:740 (+) Transcript_4748:128-2347(+)